MSACTSKRKRACREESLRRRVLFVGHLMQLPYFASEANGEHSVNVDNARFRPPIEKGMFLIRLKGSKSLQIRIVSADSTGWADCVGCIGCARSTGSQKSQLASTMESFTQNNSVAVVVARRFVICDGFSSASLKKRIVSAIFASNPTKHCFTLNLANKRFLLRVTAK